MKLKSLTHIDNRLEKFNKYIDSIDFDSHRHKGKDIFYKNNNGFYAQADEIITSDQLKMVIKVLMEKYWKDFESGIEFHKYDENWFIEVKQKKDDKNVWEFIAETMDDSIYFKFDTNFIVNL